MENEIFKKFMHTKAIFWEPFLRGRWHMTTHIYELGRRRGSEAL